jgi:hypothetical protein
LAHRHHHVVLVHAADVMLPARSDNRVGPTTEGFAHKARDSPSP